MRGKHANSADATRAREGAISEAESLRRQLAKMTKQNAELSTTLASEREASANRTREFVRQSEESTSPAVEVLRQQVADAEQRAVEAAHEIGLGIRDLMHSRTDFKATREFYAALAPVVGITVADFLHHTEGTRSQRRQTPKTMRKDNEIRAWAQANGRPT